MPPTMFPNTPSGGRVEARAGLARANARRGNARPLRDLERFFPVRHHADVQAVLDTLVTEGDVEQPTTGHYALTTQGLASFRHHPNPRFMCWPVEANT